MPQPTPKELHVDGYLTDFSVAFAQDASGFVANQVFPTVPVAKKSDLYLIFDESFFKRDEFETRPLGGRSKTVGYKVTNDSYSCEEESLAHLIDDRIRANADEPMDPDRAATRLLTEQAMIHKDLRWASTFFAASIWANDIQGVAATPTLGTQILQWDQTGANPMSDIDYFKDVMYLATQRMPNVLVVGTKVWRVLKQSTDILERIKYTQRGVVTEELVASMLGLDKIVVARGVQNTAAEGIAASYSWINTEDSMLLLYTAPAPALEQPSAGYTFAWTGLLPGATNEMGGVIERGRDTFAHSDHIELRIAYDMKVIAPTLGTYFYDVVA